MRKKVITTTVTPQQIELKRRAGLKWNYLIEKGFEFLNSEAGSKTRQIEDNNLILRTKVQDLAARLYALEQKQNKKIGEFR